MAGVKTAWVLEAGWVRQVQSHQCPVKPDPSQAAGWEGQEVLAAILSKACPPLISSSPRFLELNFACFCLEMLSEPLQPQLKYWRLRVKIAVNDPLVWSTNDQCQASIAKKKTKPKTPTPNKPFKRKYFATKMPLQLPDDSGGAAG